MYITFVSIKSRNVDFKMYTIVVKVSYIPEEGRSSVKRASPGGAHTALPFRLGAIAVFFVFSLAYYSLYKIYLGNNFFVMSQGCREASGESLSLV